MRLVARLLGLGHELRAKYPTVNRMASLWTRSYFAATAGNVSQETIRRYIEAQKGVRVEWHSDFRNSLNPLLLCREPPN